MSWAREIQGYIDLVGGDDYLEIGVDKGDTFRSIQAKNKIAVDVEFRFEITPKPGEHYFQIPSDQYFLQNRKPIDGVIFVDGKHTYEQALRDIENSLSVMTNRSVVLVDDCSPNSEGTAERDDTIIVSNRGSWCGDVWKAIAHLRATRDDLNIRTYTNFPGLSVIRFGKPDSTLDISISELISSGYDLLDSARGEILNGRTEIWPGKSGKRR